MCLYISRPGLANERMRRYAAGQDRAGAEDAVVRQHAALGDSPQELMQRLAAPVPHPRPDRIRYRGG